jgi:hypothetical protein
LARVVGVSSRQDSSTPQHWRTRLRDSPFAQQKARSSSSRASWSCSRAAREGACGAVEGGKRVGAPWATGWLSTHCATARAPTTTVSLSLPSGVQTRTGTAPVGLSVRNQAWGCCRESARHAGPQSHTPPRGSQRRNTSTDRGTPDRRASTGWAHTHRAPHESAATLLAPTRNLPRPVTRLGGVAVQVHVAALECHSLLHQRQARNLAAVASADLVQSGRRRPGHLVAAPGVAGRAKARVVHAHGAGQ